MIGLLLATPIGLSLCVLFFRKRMVFRFAPLVHALITIICTAGLALGSNAAGLPRWIAPYFGTDAISILFLALMSLVYLATAIYSFSYFRNSDYQPMREALFAICLMLFVAAMSAALLSTHLAFFWVFLEMTTLTTAVLIYHERTKSALEATWKYVFICSIGITLAFVGIILLSLGSRSIESLFIHDLIQHADQIQPFWLKMAFAFILVGFGTKIGIAPIHAWLPDAHSEAPSPISALLSGTLLNTALIGYIRFYQIITATSVSAYARHLTLAVGFLSLLISAAFMLRIVNYKRMLAYSSIENMGLIFIGLGLGGVGLFAAMLHTAAHSLSKTVLFLTTGNIYHLYGSKRIADVHGLLSKSPANGWIWMLSFLAISGVPPFPAFFSKFMLVQACYEQSGWLAILFLLLLVIVFAGMAGVVLEMIFGAESHPAQSAIRSGWQGIVPQIALLMLSLVIGLSIPGPIRMLLDRAAELIP